MNSVSQTTMSLGPLAFNDGCRRLGDYMLPPLATSSRSARLMEEGFARVATQQDDRPNVNQLAKLSTESSPLLLSAVEGSMIGSAYRVAAKRI